MANVPKLFDIQSESREMDFFRTPLAFLEYVVKERGR